MLSYEAHLLENPEGVPDTRCLNHERTIDARNHFMYQPLFVDVGIFFSKKSLM